MASPIGPVAAAAAQRLQQANPLGDRGALVPFGATPGAEGGAFGDVLTNAINQVSMAQERSRDLTGAFLRGENVEIHQVMAASEEAGISLELMVEVRNKFAEAYRTLINMQS